MRFRISALWTIFRSSSGETIRVYDLKQGDSYSVSELTTKREASSGDVLASIVNAVTGSADESVLPAGFSLVSRKAGGEEQSGTGNTIEGKIVTLVDGEIPASNKLEFTNNYSASPVKLDAQNGLSAKKVLEGRDWADGDSFTVQNLEITVSELSAYRVSFLTVRQCDLCLDCEQ